MGLLSGRQGFMPVNKVAPLPVATIVFLSEVFTFFRLVFNVLLVISQQLMGAMSELALLPERAVSFLHELLAKFGFLLGALKR